MKFVIDYALKDVMTQEQFGRYITKGKILDCKEEGNKNQPKTLIEVNQLRAQEGYEPVTISCVKYYW
ncbi:hypothetical protein LIT25_23965 [Bacillus sp. F19]|nr:hypothetical protein LIT25_23965 [Bacillus sp. F19]